MAFWHCAALASLLFNETLVISDAGQELPDLAAVLMLRCQCNQLEINDEFVENLLPVRHIPARCVRTGGG